MDESYAKSFERAYQMLTELKTQSVLRPNEQDGRSHMFSRRRADGCEEENLYLLINGRKIVISKTCVRAGLVFPAE